MPKPNAYHYIAAFPRHVDAPNQPWPVETIARFRAIPGVVDAIFPDLTASWRPAGAELAGLEPNIESRRRFVEVYTDADTPTAARETEAAIRALIVALKKELGEDNVTYVRLLADDVEVL